MSAAAADVGREETRHRRALNKAFALALKNRAKGTAWRYSQGVLFREFQGWFLSAPAAIWIGKRRSQIEIHCKPMRLDPVFWEIVEAVSNVAMPLSFRHFGAWTCRTPASAEQELDEGSGDVAAIAAEAFAWLEAQLRQFESWTTEDFLQQLRQHPRTHSYLATVVTTLFTLGEFTTAESLCNDAIKRNDACGFSIYREAGAPRTFPELALSWLQRRRELLC